MVHNGVLCRYAVGRCIMVHYVMIHECIWSMVHMRDETSDVAMHTIAIYIVRLNCSYMMHFNKFY